LKHQCGEYLNHSGEQTAAPRLGGVTLSNGSYIMSFGMTLTLQVQVRLWDACLSTPFVL